MIYVDKYDKYIYRIYIVLKFEQYNCNLTHIRCTACRYINIYIYINKYCLYWLNRQTRKQWDDSSSPVRTITIVLNILFRGYLIYKISHTLYIHRERSDYFVLYAYINVYK